MSDFEDIARRRVSEAMIDEREVHREPITIRLSGLDEPWDLIVTNGTRIGGIGRGGRVLVVLPGGAASDRSRWLDPLAGLAWSVEHGKPFIHHVWVDPEARGEGLATELVDAYRKNVARKVVIAGPFSPGGRALAQSVGAKIVENPAPESPPKRYITVITPGDLMIVRTPSPGPKPRVLLKALTPIMREHGMKQKDLQLEFLASDAFEAELRAGQPKWARNEPLLPADQYYLKQNEDLLPKIRAAFDGDFERFSKFWLYDWQDDGFVLVRKPKANENPAPLDYATAIEAGVMFETDVPVTFEYLRNTERSPYMGARFQQDIEPAGRYILLRESGSQPPRGWETGKVSFRRPLVLSFNEDHGNVAYDKHSWKAQLQRAYGKTGKSLSKQLLRDGYDGIVTVGYDSKGRAHTMEIVDLQVVGARRPNPSERHAFKYRYLGTNEDEDTCGCCGRADLKHVAWLVALDEDGNEIGQPIAYGTTCAGQLLRDAYHVKGKKKPTKGQSEKLLEEARQEAVNEAWRRAEAQPLSRDDAPPAVVGENEYGVPTITRGAHTYIARFEWVSDPNGRFGVRKFIDPRDLPLQLEASKTAWYNIERMRRAHEEARRMGLIDVHEWEFQRAMQKRNPREGRLQSRIARI